MDWFIKLEAQPDDADLELTFQKWLSANPEHAEAFAKIADMWDLPELDQATAKLKSLHSTETADTNIVHLQPPHHKKLRSFMQAATGIAAVLFIAVGIYQYPALMLEWRSDYLTYAGQQKTVTLPDGSQMLLNTASAVALDFRDGKRVVSLLQGEAYFDVLKDDDHPFIVTAQFSITEVKGTAFTVLANDDRDIVTLKRGKVQVALTDNSARFVELTPGQEVTAGPDTLSPVKQANIETSLAWLNGRMTFSSQRLETVVAEVARYYPHSILITRQSLRSALVSGDYRIDNPEGILRSLAAATDSDVYRLPGGILIMN